eukprot:4322455-Amphidinium_carterae.2
MSTSTNGVGDAVCSHASAKELVSLGPAYRCRMKGPVGRSRSEGANSGMHGSRQRAGCGEGANAPLPCCP